MKRFQSITQNYINNQKHREYLAVVSALSIPVSLAVSAEFIMPTFRMADAGNESGTIIIKNTKQESHGVVMPSTGGEGVTRYYVTGAGLMFGAAVMMVRRRKKFYSA